MSVYLLSYTDEDRERVPTNRSWSPWPQMADFLQDNQNEDCLYLNIFAPASGKRGSLTHRKYCVSV